MPAGALIWDENHNLIVDLTTRLSRVVNVATLPGNSSGTIDLSALSGTPWFSRGHLGINSLGYAVYPLVTIVGKTIQWNTAGSTSSTHLLYGMY